MIRDLNPKTLLTFFGPWALLLVVTLLIDWAIWKIAVLPQQEKLKAWREMEIFTELKPKLEALIVESNQLREDSKQSLFDKDDPSQAMQVIQSLALKHRIEVGQINLKGKDSVSENAKRIERDFPGFSAVSMDLNATGGFDRLARWMNDMESQDGFQIDAWTMKSDKDSSKPPQLNMGVTVLLKGK